MPILTGKNSTLSTRESINWWSFIVYQLTQEEKKTVIILCGRSRASCCYISAVLHHLQISAKLIAVYCLYSHRVALTETPSGELLDVPKWPSESVYLLLSDTHLLLCYLVALCLRKYHTMGTSSPLTAQMATKATSATTSATDYMSGPTQERRIIIQSSLLVLLMIFGILMNGSMCALFVRFKSMRNVVKLGLVLDLAIVELLDVMVNIPLFMDYYLFTQKRNLTIELRWYTVLFHRYFLLNDLFTQLGLTLDCLLGVRYGYRYDYRKTTRNILVYIFMKWVVLFILLLSFSLDDYGQDFGEIVSDEVYQRVLFGPRQIIWKVVIPATLGTSALFILLTTCVIKKSRDDIKRRYGLRVFGRGSKDHSKALATLVINMAMQTALRIPAITYSYIAIKGDIENDRWYAFSAYFFLFASSSLMPVIFYSRAMRFRRALLQFLRHPCKASSYLDHVASLGVTMHRNGMDMKVKVICKGVRGDIGGGVRLEWDSRVFSNTPSREQTLATDTSIRSSRGNISTDSSMLRSRSATSVDVIRVVEAAEYSINVIGDDAPPCQGRIEAVGSVGVIGDDAAPCQGKVEAVVRVGVIGCKAPPCQGKIVAVDITGVIGCKAPPCQGKIVAVDITGVIGCKAPPCQGNIVAVGSVGVIGDASAPCQGNKGAVCNDGVIGGEIAPCKDVNIEIFTIEGELTYDTKF
ncbi:uncharacterized protein LOC116619881 [Nematostella vectensis]|uniref:uncharacterized protein LOC116619881 n=1 Tax=Nematostella vectensis TaxID=45351 RepID=UPI00207710CC|nr:uncharacterized protein LOC116619881 [Nematostella vectensis]